jgi:thiamine biosynthesis lipoprotein
MAVHRFSHQAMGTIFEVFTAGEDKTYASQAAAAAFAEVDRLERLFSRFDPASEIRRANRLRPDEELAVGLETFECLTLAEEARQETGGAFDVNARAEKYGDTSLISPEISDVSPYFLLKRDGQFLLRRLPQDPSTFAGLDLDLGGIGKGYALDRAGEILKDWSLENVLIHGGTSTALAWGSAPPENDGEKGKGWPVGVGGGWPEAPQRVTIAGRAMSGSGPEVKGQHIIDPRTGFPAQGHLAAWASHPSAALSDAYSTAFLVMATPEVEKFCRRHPEVWACVVIANGDVRVFNPEALEPRP